MQSHEGGEGLKHPSCEERLRKLELLTPESGRDFVDVYKHVMGGNEGRKAGSQQCPVTGQEAMEAK